METTAKKTGRKIRAAQVVSLLAVGLFAGLGATATLPGPLGLPVGGEAKHTIDPDSFARRYETHYLDAQSLRNQALAQQPVSLSLFGTNHTFALSPILDMPLGSSITTVDSNGLPMQLPVSIILFRGLTPDPGTTALLSLPGNWVAGEIRTPSGTIYLEPKEHKGGSGLVQTIAYRDSDRLPVASRSPEADVHTSTMAAPEGNGSAPAGAFQATSSGDPSGYEFCADEGDYCSFSGTKDVAYGASGKFYYRSAVVGGIDCSNAEFGDPIPYTVKACYIRNPEVEAGPPGYVYCAKEWQHCSFSGTKSVAYGANGAFTHQVFTGGTDCTNDVFGDPAYGVAKACYTKESPNEPEGPPPPAKGTGASASANAETNTCSYRPTVEIFVDWQYLDTYGGSTWPNQVRTIMAMVNNLYAQFCLTFDIKGLIYDYELNDDYDWGAAFWKFRQLHPETPDRNFKYYFSGKDYQGCTMGEANAQPGYYSMMQQYGDFCHFGFGGSNSEQAYIAKHEIGHNHNAAHSEMDDWWDQDGFYHRTIMKSEITGIIHDYFSYGGICSCQNNAARIRAHVNENHI